MAMSPLSVLLGLTDTECKAKTSWNLNKIGGLPDWLNLHHHHPVCQLCKNQLYLVVQIYCPLSGSPYHRTLYVFACTEKRCQQDSRSWCVLRMQKLDEKDMAIDTSDKSNGMDNVQDWTEDADDWGSDDDDDDEESRDAGTLLDSISEPQGDVCFNNYSKDGESSLSNHPLTNLKNLSLCEPIETSTLQNGCQRSFVHSYYMNVFTEPEEDTNSGEKEQRLLSEYIEREGLPSATLSAQLSVKGKEGSAEIYEKSLPTHGNVTFSKFTKRLGRCPAQCLRYCWSGKPLLMSSFPDGFAPPVCQFCGATRIFEFQLMSSLISVLKSSQEKDSLLDFGTVLIYSCSQSCWENDECTTTREECAILQKDPDHNLIGHL